VLSVLLIVSKGAGREHPTPRRALPRSYDLVSWQRRASLALVKNRESVMAVMKVYLYGEEVLRRKASPVEKIDDGVRELIRNMAETMRQASGVGLAAPQVGDSRRVIVAEVPQENSGLIALINPVIVESSGISEYEEGCLSVPGISAKVKRAAEVVVEGLTPDGKQMRKKYTGLLATVVQHEIDHLDGILFVDRLGFLGRSVLSFKLRSLARANKA